MTTLTELLEQEARKRGLIASNETVTIESAFALVRDMPYQRAGSRRPESSKARDDFIEGMSRWLSEATQA